MDSDNLIHLVPRAHHKRLLRLHKGLQSTTDPVSWRTLVTDVRLMLGTQDEDHNRASKTYFEQGKTLITSLLAGTYLEALTGEVIEAVFAIKQPKQTKPLDILLLNGRFSPDLLLYNCANEVKARGLSVAVVNPIGRYNDQQTRVLGPWRTLKPVKHLVVLASTQRQLGGSYQVLGQVLRLLRNQDFARVIENVHVVIPMFGGSRGHRLGQDNAVGYEVLESIYDAKLLALPAKDLRHKVHGETWIERFKFALSGGRIPPISFYSVDIHDHLDPRRGFIAEGFEFINISPVADFAREILKYLDQKKLSGNPIRLIAPDKSAWVRTQALADQLLQIKNYLGDSLDLICMDKNRPKAGQVDKVNVSIIEQRSKGQTTSQSVAPASYDWHQPKVTILIDDMFDTCGTAQKNVELIRRHSLRIPSLVFAATHGIFSKGVEVLDMVKADHFFVGNTLLPRGIQSRKDVTLVDVAPSIINQLIGG